VGERGQITIPKRLRRSLGIRAGEDVEFEERDGLLVVRRVGASDPLDRLVGLVSRRSDVDAYLAESRGPAWSAVRDAVKTRRAGGRAGKRRR
jgi:AbrB family looped-hinge helix DNA binding protein